MSAYNWMLLEVNFKKNLFRAEFSAIKWRQMTASLISPQYAALSAQCHCRLDLFAEVAISAIS